MLQGKGSAFFVPFTLVFFHKNTIIGYFCENYALCASYLCNIDKQQ